jgi:hypothetical protein
MNSTEVPRASNSVGCVNKGSVVKNADGPLAKEAASSSEAETAYSKIPKRAVVRELKEEGELVWQREWDASTKDEITKSFFSIIRDRISKRLQTGINLSTIVTGQGTLRSYYHRVKITDDPKCV